MLAWCVHTIADIPSTAFAFVGLESLPKHAIPALASITEAWPAGADILAELLIKAVAKVPKKSKGPHTAPDLAFLRQEEYRATMSESRFALVTVPPTFPR